MVISTRSRRSFLHKCRSYILYKCGRPSIDDGTFLHKCYHPTIDDGHNLQIMSVNPSYRSFKEYPVSTSYLKRFIRRNRPLLSILRLTKGFINRKDSAIFQARMDNFSKFLVLELKRLISSYGCLIKVLKITALRWIKTVITKFCKPIGSKLYYWSLNVIGKIYFSSL